MTNETSIFAIIEQHVPNMTGIEEQIAYYFMKEALDEADLSSQQVSSQLHVSLAALTRFAKKCGFKGYREFIFAYLHARESLDQHLNTNYSPLTKRVLLDYEGITKQSHSLIDEDQLQTIAEMIEDADRVYFFGKGSSGLVAREMKLRLMRLGVVCEALTERESFAWTISILDPKCLVIAFSLSGKTSPVIEHLRAAKEKGAKTVLFTTRAAEFKEDLTETVQVASVRHLDYGNRISPQYPMLLLLDILYAFFLEINKEKKEAIFNPYQFQPSET